jgi:hypothetical protein
MIEQYLTIEQSRVFLPACIYETPVWRYLLYKPVQEIFDEVTYDPAVPSTPFLVNAVYIDGVEYTPQSTLALTRANPASWNQDGETLYVHYAGGYPTWLFYYSVYGAAVGFSNGETRFFNGIKFRAGLDIKLKYKIEADNLEYSKMKLIGGDYEIPSQGEFDSLTDILGNNITTSYSIDGVNRIPLNAMFIKDAEITTSALHIKGGDKRENLNREIAADIFTEAEYPKMKKEYYGKNKQEAFGYCRGIPAVCTDQRGVYTEGTTLKTYRTFRAASHITTLSKVEVKMTQPDSSIPLPPPSGVAPPGSRSGEVWVDQTSSSVDIGGGAFALPCLNCMPLLPNGQPDFGNDPYEVRVTGVFVTNGGHWAILSYLLPIALGGTWESQCNTAEMTSELSGTGTVGIFVEKATKIFNIIETLQSSGIYGWQLHDCQGKLTIRKDNNARTRLTKKIKGVDITNINEVSVRIGIDNYATTVQVEYQRNYSEDSNNVIQDDSNRYRLYPIYRNDKTYTAESYLESEAEARERCTYLLSHFITPRLEVNNIVLRGEQWLDLRIYDIIGVYLEQELRRDTLPTMLMVLSNELRRQDATVFGDSQTIEYVIDDKPVERRKFGGNIYFKIMRIDMDIATLTTTINGLWIANI